MQIGGKMKTIGGKIASRRLTLGSVVVCVERELDWEANPRKVTLVYAGTEKTLNATWWGKKVN